MILKLEFLFIFLILSTSVMGVTSMNFLTKGQADTLYCPIGGICTLQTLTVYDLHVIGTILNVTVTNIYLNVTYLQGIENYATIIYVDDRVNSIDNHTARVDSNASTACSDGEYLDGNGLCIAFNATGDIRWVNVAGDTMTGDLRIKDSDGEYHNLSRDLQISDEISSNITLTGLNGTLGSDGNLTITTLSGENIVVNIDKSESILDRNSDSIIITSGTNESPVLTQVVYSNAENPTLIKRTSLSLTSPSVAAFLQGANFTYVSAVGLATTNNLIGGIFNRFFRDGSTYRSGFEINVSTNMVNISTGVISFLFSEIEIIQNHSTSDLYVHLHTDGSFHQHFTLDNCETYNDGSSISNNKFFNVVFCMAITHDGAGVMYTTTQDKPSTEYTKAIDAEIDGENTINFFPPNEIVSLACVPVVRIVVRRSGGVNTIQTLSKTGLLYDDLRGTVTKTSSSPPPSGITSYNDLTNIPWTNDGDGSITKTETGDVDMDILNMEKEFASNNTNETMLNITRTTSKLGAENGMGATIAFNLPNETGGLYQVATISSVATAMESPPPDYEVVVSSMYEGVLQESYRTYQTGMKVKGNVVAGAGGANQITVAGNSIRSSTGTVSFSTNDLSCDDITMDDLDANIISVDEIKLNDNEYIYYDTTTFLRSYGVSIGHRYEENIVGIGDFIFTGYPRVNISDSILETTNDVKAGNVFENQPFSYGGKKIDIISPYVTKDNEYQGQLHAHSDESDGADTPTELETAYKNAGYDFIVLTDHNSLTANPSVTGILHINGVEETAIEGHIGNIGATAQQADPSAQDIIDDIILDDALAIMNHPNWDSVSWGNPWSDIELESIEGYFSLEIYNSHITNKNAEDKWDEALTKNIRSFGVATDDCHDIGGSAFDVAWVQVFADNLNSSDIIDSLKRGNFYSSTGANLSISLDGKNIIASTDRSSTIEWIISGGTVTQTNLTTTSATYTVIGDEDYVRIKITRDSDSKLAWSNPIYIYQTPTSKLEKGGLIRGNVYMGNDTTFSSWKSVDDSLLGWWQFNNNYNDSSQNYNDGIPEGNPVVSNNILELDGTGDYVNISSRVVDVNSFTVSFWVYPTISEYKGLVSQDTGTGSDREWFVAVSSTEDIRTRVYNTDGTSYEQITTDNCLTNNQWHFVVMTVDDSTKKVYAYVDLVEVIDDDFTKSVRHNTNAVTNIGRTYSDDFVFTGNMANVRIYKRVLSRYEMKQIYAEGNKRYGHFDDLFITENITAVNLPKEGVTATSMYVCWDTDGHLFLNETGCR